MQHAWKFEIVNVITLAAQETSIFDALSGMTQTMDFGFNWCFSHVMLLPPFYRRRIERL
jgi:hypothetical protein